MYMERVTLVIEPSAGRPALPVSALSADPPWLVIRATDLKDARALYVEHATDVVVLDLDPDGDLTLLDEVLRWQPQPAVVAISDNTDPAFVGKAIDLGAQDVIERRSVTGDDLRRVLGLAARRHLAVVRARNREAIAHARANALSAYVGAVTHDLRAPLATLISMADMARCIAKESETLRRAHEQSDDGTIAEMGTLVSTMDRIEQLGHRALSFTDTLLADAETGTATRAQLDFGQLVAEAWHLVEVDGVMLTIGDLPAHVFGLEAATSQVLVNLLSNAINHIQRPGGRIHVECIEEVDRVQLRLHDNGPGVREEDRLSIFKPGTSSVGSTGLGLSTVQRQMQRQSGRCWVESSSVLPGAAMVLEFPARDSSRALATRRALRSTMRRHEQTTMSLDHVSPV
jgi:signal transduction histidine kinase